MTYANQKISGLRYGERERNTLDLYLPANPIDAPVLVFFHGGRWFRNDASQIELYDRVSQLNDAGFVIASINFTYSTEAIWPAQLEDALAAIAYVHQASDTYGYQSDRLSLWGQSSGAHVAMMAMLNLAQDDQSPIAALVHWYGPSELSRISQDRIDDEVPGENERFSQPTPESQLVGSPVSDVPDLAAEASPVSRIRSLEKDMKLPPVLLVHGDQDAIISPLQSQRLFNALKARDGVQVALRVVEGAGHGGDRFDEETAPAVEFLVRHSSNE